VGEWVGFGLRFGFGTGFGVEREVSVG